MKSSILFALVLCACGRSGADLCETSTLCPGDPATSKITPTSQSITDCKHNRQGPCGSKYESWASCGWDKQTCKADGTTDWDALNAACTDEFNAYFTCCANTDGGC
jgi:hypothetical protein